MSLRWRFVDWLLVGCMRHLCGRSSARLGVFGAGRHAYSIFDQNKQEYIYIHVLFVWYSHVLFMVFTCTLH